MLLAAVISLFSSTLVLVLVDCFFKKHKTMSFLLQILTFTALFCGGVALMYYKNKLDLFGIMLNVSILPQILTLFQLLNMSKIKKNAPNLPNNDISEEIINPKSKVPKDYGFLLKSIGLALSSISMSICGLVLGRETF